MLRDRIEDRGDGRRLHEGRRAAAEEDRGNNAAAGARRPHQCAVDGGFEFLDMAVRPSHAQRAYETRAAFVWRPGVALAQLLLYRAHGALKVSVRSGPARGLNAWRAAERIDRQTGIIGQRGQSRSCGGGARLDARVLEKTRAGL